LARSLGEGFLTAVGVYFGSVGVAYLFGWDRPWFFGSSAAIGAGIAITIVTWFRLKPARGES
jgi:hypothetical protein